MSAEKKKLKKMEILEMKIQYPKLKKKKNSLDEGDI